MLLDDVLSIAVVGVSSNTKKYGHKVYKHFLELGSNVSPVNHKGGEILGKKVFVSLTEIPEKIDLVVLVVPPQVSEEIVKEASLLGIKKVWFQPGSESKKAVDYCQENNILTQTDSCIMLQ